MKKPRGWKVQRGFRHDLEPAWFAYQYSKTFAKGLGLRFKARVRVGVCKYTGWWRGHAWGKRGRGHIWIAMNHKIDPHESIDKRFANQPGYWLFGIQDTMCFLMAHECGHVIGYGGDKAGEMACNSLGYRAVQAWRERECEHPACMI